MDISKLPRPGSGSRSGQQKYRYGFLRLEQWRQLPFRPTIHHYVPGLVPGLALFAGYCILDFAYKSVFGSSDHHDDHGDHH